MKVPNADRAVVSERKIRLYLLSDANPEGRSKAAFFSLYGFSEDFWQELMEALGEHVNKYEIASFDDNKYGTYYTVEGNINTPSGGRPLIRSVWVIDKDGEIPRLITAYPIRRRVE